MKIGICDWGIGGVGLYQLLRKKSSADVIYISDTGFTPYGKVAEIDLKDRLSKVFHHFNKLGVEKIIVGCNAASTVLVSNNDIIGVIDHGVNLVVKQGISKVGIVGGRRTIESGIYKTKLEQRGIEVFQRIAQPLSARIEAGDVDSIGLDKDIAEIFEPIKNIPHILLACTHYPLISQKITNFTDEVVLLDPAEEMLSWIVENWSLESGDGTIRFQTTGDTGQMRNSLLKLYQIDSNQIEKIEL